MVRPYSCNANLVINTDADQIILADASPSADGGRPFLVYTAGGLEEAEIRKHVCEILEGETKPFRSERVA